MDGHRKTQAALNPDVPPDFISAALDRNPCPIQRPFTDRVHLKKSPHVSHDYAFYRQDEIEVLRFRTHSEFFKMFTAEPLVQLENEHDSYVTRRMVTAIIEKIEREMAQHGLPLPPNESEEFEELEYAVPEDFYWSEPEDWVAALPYYRALLYILLEDVRADGCLVRGWEA